MKTLIIKKVDNLDVVVGFGRLLIDGVATNKTIKEGVSNLLEYKNAMITSMAYEEVKNSNLGLAKIESFKKKRDDAKEAFDKKILGISGPMVHYFNPKAGESVITSEEFDEYYNLLQDASNDGKLLLRDKTSLVDFKGCKYYLDNNGVITSHVIENIGDDYPSDAMLSVTIKQLNNLEGDSLRLSELNSALSIAAAKRSEFEIMGDDPDMALSRSQFWYQEQVDLINKKYE